MASLQLNTIPLDGLRPILSFIDLKSLIKLYATFDRKLQALIASPNAFAFLCIKAAGKDIPIAPYRYFVTAIRNVNHLKFENEVDWSPKSILLLLALNPRILEIGTEFLNQSVCKMLKEAKLFPKNEELKHMAQFFLKKGIPNFSALTPRLEALKLDSLSFYACGPVIADFRVTNTLTALKVTSNFPLDHLPSTLLSLDVEHHSTHTIALEKVFDQFKALQSLTIRGPCLTPSSFTFPSTLNTFNCIQRNSSDLHVSTGILAHPSLKTTRVSSVRLVFPVHSLLKPPNLDLAQLLPPSLKTLSLGLAHSKVRTETGSDVKVEFLKSLPTSLTDLSIEVMLLKKLSSDEESPVVQINALSSLERLEIGSLEVLDPSSLSIELSSLVKLPSRLKTLILSSTLFKPLTLLEIRNLPDSLTLLQVTSFDLDLAEVLSLQLPTCHLFVQHRVSPWLVPSRVCQYSPHWLPHLDISKHITFVEDYYRRLRVHLSIDFGTQPMLSRFNLETNIGFPLAPAAEIATFAAQLKSVILPATDFTVDLALYPAGLTSIVAPLSICAIRRWPFNDLTHLDAPSARIPFALYLSIANLTLLKATIIELDDVNVEPFLTRVLSRKTRLNCSIAIEYNATGALLCTDDGPAEVTWQLIQEHSESFLNRLLASPMPRIDVEKENDVATIENDTIGRIVTSLTLEKSEYTPICIPTSATKVSITKPNWITGPDWLCWPSKREDGLRLQSISSDLPSLPSRLVHLEIRSRTVNNIRQIAYPKSLKYLSVFLSPLGFSASIDTIKFPPQLEVLIWWNDIPIRDLPSSLQDLVLLTPSQLHPNAGKYNLPQLKSLHINETNDWTLLRTLPLAQLETCVVYSPIFGEVPAEYASTAKYLTLKLVKKGHPFDDVVAEIQARRNASPSLAPTEPPSADPEASSKTPPAANRKKAVRRPRP